VACVICTDDHYTNQCPLLRDPKPPVAYCATSDSNGVFFHIQAANEHDIVSTEFSLIATLIKVESGDASEQLLLTTLARIVPVPWHWEAQEEGHKCFIVPFPSKEELTRMVAVGTITTKNKEGTFSIEEFVDDVQPIKVLDQVWVTVTKVPSTSFFPSFVGSWYNDWSYSEGGCSPPTAYCGGMNPCSSFGHKKIPKFADVCVKGCMYRLFSSPMRM
jgi:hypothetical protein